MSMHSTKLTRAMLLAGLGVMTPCLSACSADPILVTPRAFERPARVTFTCFDNETAQTLPLARCDNDAREANPSAALHALVTQTATGEIAAVDLRSNRLLDSSPTVPGYTFVPVGDVPSDVITPSLDPTSTYVTNFGSRDLWALPTRTFRLAAGVPPPAPTRITFDAPPVAVTLTSDESELLVALADEGVVARVPVTAGVLGTPVDLALTTTIPAAVTATEDVPYEKICDADVALVRPAILPPRAPRTVGTTPRPVAFEVDREGSRVYVADANLPIIHVIDAAAGVELAPIAVGVPTVGLALTPPVPGTLLGSCAAGDPCKQYLYAIDAIDGSVLVVDLSTGAVLTVAADGLASLDRIRFNSGARALEIISSDYPGGAFCSPENELAAGAAPDRMRGVFLAAALNDGSVRIIDVFDLDAPCRGGVDCVNPRIEGDIVYYAKRHRPRIGTFLTDGVQSVGTPAFTVDGTTIPVATTGVTEGLAVPDLIPLEPSTCASPLARLYSTESGAPILVCGLTDPWASTGERWVAVLNGAIAATRGARGNFGDDPLDLSIDVPLCSRGVLGSADVAAVAAEAPEAGYAGDAIVILSRPDEDVAGCSGDIALLPDGTHPPVSLPIAEAFQGRVRLEGTASVNGADISLARVRECYPTLFSYEVRVREAYAVSGDRSGFVHRVALGAEDRCVVDLAADPRRQGRAIAGRTFRNPLVAFHIASTDTGNAAVAFAFIVGQIPTRLGLDVGFSASGRVTGTLPNDLRFNRGDNRLYVVDLAQRGLVQFSIDPFGVLRSFE